MQDVNVIHIGQDTWSWLYMVDMVALITLCIWIVVRQYQKKVGYSKGLGLAYSVCALVSIIYLMLYLRLVAHSIQVEWVAEYIWFNLKFYLLAVVLMIGWILWRAFGRQRPSPKKDWALWGVIILIGLLYGVFVYSIKSQGMMPNLTLSEYFRKAHGLYSLLYIMLICMENNASRKGSQEKGYAGLGET